MGIVRNCLVALTMLYTSAFATESSDLLNAFNEVSLEVPSIAFDVWDSDLPIDSSEFKTHYVNQFEEYVAVASKLAIRAVACANGDIPQVEDYQSMTDMKQLYVSIIETVSAVESQLTLWVDINDGDAIDELGRLVPKLTVSYSRMLFELSSCSGYLYGELVN
jgi:hypothetical protein